MTELSFQFGEHLTAVKVSSNILDCLGEELRSAIPGAKAACVVVVADEQVASLYGPQVAGSLTEAGFSVLQYRVEPGEASKRLAVADELYTFLAHHGVTRDAVLLALGGGVVSDLTGFVAATWMRGVRFAICPTTLEADVDACLGGKTGVNIPSGKNLVGAFHHPALVAVDPMCLTTLEARDVRAGLAESIKHAMISSETFVAWHEHHSKAILNLDEDIVTELIAENLRIKGDIVQRDPMEQSGPRAHLNFGHTIGHAIESCCNYALRHGECVALGMLAACRLSNELGMLDKGAVARIAELLLRFGLPTTLQHSIDTDTIIQRTRLDKKHRAGAMRLVLLEEIGRPVVRTDVSEKMLRAAYESLAGGG